MNTTEGNQSSDYHEGLNEGVKIGRQEVIEAVKAAMRRPHHYMNADGHCHAGDAFEQGVDFVSLIDFYVLRAALDGAV